MEHEDMKAAVKALAATKKVNRTIKLSPEHDAYLQGYNASDLIGLLLDRFIDEKAKRVIVIPEYTDFSGTKDKEEPK